MSHGLAAVVVAATLPPLPPGGAGMALEEASSLGATAPAPATGFVAPVGAAPVSQPYGCTALALEPASRLCPQGHFHSGVDLAAPAATPVRATLPGVARVLLSTTGYGLHVVLDHGDGLSSLYAHLGAVTVADGETVAAGEVIGAVGSTGTSTGPHLHFEIRRDGLPEDPSLDLTQGSDAPRHGERP